MFEIRSKLDEELADSDKISEFGEFDTALKRYCANHHRLRYAARILEVLQYHMSHMICVDDVTFVV